MIYACEYRFQPPGTSPGWVVGPRAVADGELPSYGEQNAEGNKGMKGRVVQRVSLASLGQKGRSRRVGSIGHK